MPSGDKAWFFLRILLFALVPYAVCVSALVYVYRTPLPPDFEGVTKPLGPALDVWMWVLAVIGPVLTSAAGRHRIWVLLTNVFLLGAIHPLLIVALFGERYTGVALVNAFLFGAFGGFLFLCLEVARWMWGGARRRTVRRTSVTSTDDASD